MGRLRVAVADSGAQMNALPTPIRAIGARIPITGVVGVATAPNQNKEADVSREPGAGQIPRMHLVGQLAHRVRPARPR